MVLATRFTLFVERNWKNMCFYQQMVWPPATYDVIARNHSNWLSLNFPQNVRDRWTNSYWERQVLIFYPLGKKLRKTFEGMASNPPPPPPPVRPRVNLVQRGAFAFWFHFEMKAFVMCRCFHGFRKLIKRLELLEPSYQAMNHSTSYVR